MNNMKLSTSLRYATTESIGRVLHCTPRWQRALIKRGLAEMTGESYSDGAPFVVLTQSGLDVRKAWIESLSPPKCPVCKGQGFLGDFHGDGEDCDACDGYGITTRTKEIEAP